MSQLTGRNGGGEKAPAAKRRKTAAAVKKKKQKKKQKKQKKQTKKQNKQKKLLLLWDMLEHDVGDGIIAFLGVGNKAESLRRLLRVTGHDPEAFAVVWRHLSGTRPGRLRFHVPWNWLRAYVFANPSVGAGLILHGALRAAAGRPPPVVTSPAVLLAAVGRACRGCGEATRPNPRRDAYVGAPPGGRTCRRCLCDPRFTHLFHASTLRIRQRLGISRREWSRISPAVRARVGAWRDGHFGCTLYPYKRTKACIARLRKRHRARQRCARLRRGRTS